jgi:DNA modification methylase
MISILQGDCLDILPTLPEQSVQCCVTSPPYWGLRDYGTATWGGGDAECDHRVGRANNRQMSNGRGEPSNSCLSWTSRDATPSSGDCPKCGGRRIDTQLGLESTPEEFITNMVAVFREVWRVLRDDGTLWLNLGDSYCSTDKWGGGIGGNNGKHTVAEDGSVPSWAVRSKKQSIPGLKPKDLCMMPARLAMALQADGWWLRSEIVWHKLNPMPESVSDRPTKAHEMIYLLAKAERYYYDADAIREPLQGDEIARTFRGGSYVNNSTFDNANGGKRTVTGNRKADPLEGSHGTLGMDGNGMRMPEKWSNPAGRNKRTVWTIATQPYAEEHFATFPEEIPKLCILAGSKPGDTILDPFAGSGTTGKVALELGRKTVLIELNPEYVNLIHQRTNVTPGML